MGCDLVDVRYEDPRDGQVHTRPFGTVNLSPGEPNELLEAAERFEALAARLRRLAQSPIDHSHEEEAAPPRAGLGDLHHRVGSTRAGSA